MEALASKKAARGRVRPGIGHYRPSDVFGQVLRNRRALVGVSVRTLAHALGIPVDALIRIERGVAAPLTDDQIDEVAWCLRVNESDLFAAAAKTRAAF